MHPVNFRLSQNKDFFNRPWIGYTCNILKKSRGLARLLVVLILLAHTFLCWKSFVFFGNFDLQLYFLVCSTEMHSFIYSYIHSFIHSFIMSSIAMWRAWSNVCWRFCRRSTEVRVTIKQMVIANIVEVVSTIMFRETLLPNYCPFFNIVSFDNDT